MSIVIEESNANFDKRSENGFPNRIPSDENRVLKKRDYEIDEIRVISPKLPREFMHIVRPAYFTKENSIVALTSKLASTVKDTTDETISSIKQLAGPLVDNNVKDKSLQAPHSTTRQRGSTDKKDINDVVSIKKNGLQRRQR